MLNPHNSPAVNDWFRRLDAAWRRMPADERTRQRDEVQQHLEGLVAAKVAQGQSVEAAWNAALKQFGEPTQIGRKMYQEWRRNRAGFHADARAVLFGVRLNVLVGFVIQNICWQGFMPIPWFILIGLLLLSGAGVLTYVPIGRKYPFQAIKSAFYTTILSDLWCIIGSVIAYKVHFGIPQLSVMPGNLTSFLLMPTGLIFYVAVAYFASVTKRGWYRPSWADFKITLPSRRRQVN